LTDVRLATHVTLLQLIGAVLPGARLVRTSSVVPGGVTAVEYEGVEREAMSESQSIAVAVAERAAGYGVPPPIPRLFIVSFARGSRAGALHPLDLVVAVAGRPVYSSSGMKRILRPSRPGSVVNVLVMRRGRPRSFNVPTIAYRGRTALGLYLTTIEQRPPLPIAVAFHLPNVAGSSGGLMFALQTYRMLRPFALTNARIAGTGTIHYDGSVGPIDGAQQKVVAARERGALLFLVPKENYAEVARTKGIRIVAVKNFAQALHAIRRE